MNADIQFEIKENKIIQWQIRVDMDFEWFIRLASKVYESVMGKPLGNQNVIEHDQN